MVAMNWRSWLGLDSERNPYLRMSELDRKKLGMRMGVFVLFVPVLLWAFSRLVNWLN